MGKGFGATLWLVPVAIGDLQDKISSAQAAYHNVGRPNVINWFITPIKYGYIYNKSQLLKILAPT
jgi:hypothetical protein